MPYTERDKLIHKYITSFDNGDMEGVAEVLEAACFDPELERIIKEINLAFQEEEGITRATQASDTGSEDAPLPIASDAELVRKLAKEHLHSAFDPLSNKKLNFSVVGNKKLEEVTVGDVAMMLKDANRIPTPDKYEIYFLYNNKTPIPKNPSMKQIRNLFGTLNVEVNLSDRFLDIFRRACIAIAMHIGLKNSPTPKVISFKGKLNKNW